MKRILFHDNQLNLRGTSVSLYNYAKYNEEILGNKSIIISFPNSDLSGLEKFQKRFETHLTPFHNYENFCFEHEIDYLYITKSGYKSDGYFLDSVKTLIHCVFMYNEPHGHRYAYVSDWLAKSQGYDPQKYSVPYIIDKLPEPSFSMREKFNISKDKKVFGCYGGPEQFDIPFVKQTIIEFAKKNKDYFFIFMNINRFCENIENIIFLEGTWVLENKASFVNACDAMIHARQQGEGFGCAIAEFSLENKPVITYSLSPELGHKDILLERGIYYSNQDEFLNILENFQDFILYDDYYLPYLKFSPEIIMSKFNKIFLND